MWYTNIVAGEKSAQKGEPLMRIRVRHSGAYEAAHSMTLALVTLYSGPETDIVTEYRKQSRRPSAFMAECVGILPTPENEVQAALRECCPVSKRIKLYIKKWALDKPSHYVILHRTPEGTFKLGCNRLLSCTTEPDALIDGVLMTWPNANPQIGCGQKAIVQRIFASGISAPTEILTVPELRRELMLAITVARLYQSSDTFTVWTHPGKAVFRLLEDGELVLVKTRPYATPPTKPNVVIYGDVTNNTVPEATSLPRHILPSIKGAVQMEQCDTKLGRLLKYALEARLLPYLAVATTPTRGNVYALSYDPEADDYNVAEIGTNRKIVGMPQVLRIDNQGDDVFVPDLDLAIQLKAMFFDPDVRLHIEALKGLLRMMGYKTWEEIELAFHNWDLPLTAEEDEKFEIVRSEL